MRGGGERGVRGGEGDTTSYTEHSKSRPSRGTRLHQIEGRHRARGSGATSAHVGEAWVAVGEVREQHAPRAHLVGHLARARVRG